MQSLAFRSLIQTPRIQITQHPELLQPIVATIMNGALSDVDPADAFDALVAYCTPTVYNRFETMITLTTPSQLPVFFRMEHIIEQLDSIGLFSTQSGRDMLCEMVRDSAVPLRVANPKYYGTSCLQSPLFVATMARIDDLARNSFAYDPIHKRISVEKKMPKND